jgi:putative ATPase
MKETLDAEQPLAARMRPRTLEEFVGQEHIVAPGRLLYRAIKADQLSSLVFHGPPGTGKTTLARVIANATQAEFVTINAVLAGVKEIRTAIGDAQERRQYQGQRTILFVDEVHRWNKAQQDALLPWVENGTIVLIGATTENPFFEVNRALVSRSRIFQLTPLEARHLRQIAHQALENEERGYGRYDVLIDQDALEHLIDVADGDARSLLNALELAVETTPTRFPPPPGETIHVDLQVAEESIQRRAVLYDKEGDYHFDTISAFIKSLRGSDPDAALYWLARMIYAGEDPRFIFRRMLIFASEDVGLADPRALIVTEAAASAFDRVGLPEGRFHLSHAVIYLATAPKSNSTMGFFDALKTVENEAGAKVPTHLKDANRDAKGFGHGEGYLYPHAYRDHWVPQQYLPDSLQGTVFYQPGNEGYEGSLRSQVLQRRLDQDQAAVDFMGRPGEILTFSPSDHPSQVWLLRADSATANYGREIRENLMDGIPLTRHSRVLDLSIDSAFLALEAFRRCPEGGVWSLARPVDEHSDEAQGVVFVNAGRDEVATALVKDGYGEVKFELITGRSVVGSVKDRRAFFERLARMLAVNGWIALAETWPGQGQKLSECVALNDKDMAAALVEAEAHVYTDALNPQTNWRPEDLESELKACGFVDVKCVTRTYRTGRVIRTTDIQRWFDTAKPSSYASRMSAYCDTAQLAYLRETLEDRVVGQETSWRQVVVILKGHR